MNAKKVSAYLTKIVIFILPLFFLPLTRNFFAFNKNMLLMFFALTLVAIYLINLSKQVLAQKLSIPQLISSLDLPVLSFAAAYLLSLLISSPNKVEALLQPGSAGTIFALTIMYFMLKQHQTCLADRQPPNTRYQTPILASAVVLSVVTIVFASLDSFGIKNFNFANFQIRTAAFSPAGSLLTLVSFLVICLLIAISKRTVPKYEQRAVSKGLSFIVPIIIFLALLSAASLMVRPQNRPRLLPLSAGWQIAVETFKSPKSALFGVGPGNFVNAFTRNKPIELNRGNLWAFRAGQSSNFYFQLLTEIGILGLAAFLFLLYRTYKSSSKSSRNYGVYTAFLILALIPANLLLLFVLYLLLSEASRQGDGGGGGTIWGDWGPKNLPTGRQGGAAASSSQAASALETTAAGKGTPLGNQRDPQKVELTGAAGRNRERLLLLITLPSLLLITFAFYLLIRAYAAETTMFQGIRAATAAGGAQKTYDLQREALRLNPYLSAYRVIFSQTNLALATSMSARKDLTDVDRQTISRLVNQAIVNAKLALQLTPSAATWENLASIYRALVRVAQGADVWAVSAYNQAVSFDPANPALRVAFGGLYYSLAAYDPAIRQFEMAVFLKRDYANAWYNLANAQRAANKTEQAKFSYQQTLALLNPETNDYKHVKKQLESLPESPGASPSGQLETLSPPASPSAEVKPKIKLGKEAAPEISPSPTATTTPTPTEQVSPSPQPSPSPVNY